MSLFKSAYLLFLAIMIGAGLRAIYAAWRNGDPRDQCPYSTRMTEAEAKEDHP